MITFEAFSVFYDYYQEGYGLVETELRKGFYAVNLNWILLLSKPGVACTGFSIG